MNRHGAERRLDRVERADHSGMIEPSAATATARPPAASMLADGGDAIRAPRHETDGRAVGGAALGKRTPSPLDAPVTSATRPERSKICEAFICTTSFALP